MRDPQPDDAELLVRCNGGDRAAFDRLIRRWDARVLNLAWRLTADAEEAKDVRQTVFLRLLSGGAAFDGRARFETWLVRVVINEVRDRARADGARRRRHERLDEPPPDPAPWESLARAERDRRVARAVRALPPDEREVLVLRHWQGLSFPQVADVVGAPVTTVKSRAARALERLRVWFDATERTETSG